MGTCTDPKRLLYFTITFRSFTPTPGGLEFHPGQDYYFISTSSPENIHRKVGGWCATHNMKVTFKVAQISSSNNNSADTDKIQNNTAFVNKPRSTTLKPQVLLNDKHKYYPVMETTSSEIDSNTLESAKKVVRDYQNFRRRSYEAHQNEVIKQEASRMHSASSTTSGTVLSLLLITFLVRCCLGWVVFCVYKTLKILLF